MAHAIHAPYFYASAMNGFLLSANAIMEANMNAQARTLPDIDLGLPGERANHLVVVAMSGGVDSSVVAGLVAHAGYQAVGITLQLYDHGAAIAKKGACCAGQDIHDARNVADELGVPHYVFDYESIFAESVIDDFVDTYLKGSTPIPCVRCNERVKFRNLLDAARSLGASCMATGHYVQRQMSDQGPLLFAGADHGRDQSYFLFNTTKEQLDYLRFPLGGFSKTETRAMAESMGLVVADKPDSQDICFVPEGRYTQVITKRRPDAIKPGIIRHVDGQVMGQHQGIINFTVGQRRGLGIATGDPIYVVGLNSEENEVLVGPREALKVQGLTLDEFNWLGDEAPQDGLPVLARVRSTRPPVAARLQEDDGGLTVIFDDGEEGVAPGQACVLYDLDKQGRVLGGGIIQKAIQRAWS